MRKNRFPTYLHTTSKQSSYFSLLFLFTKKNYIMKKEEITFTDVVEFIARNSDKTLRMDKLNKLTFPFTSKYTLQSGFAIPKNEMKHYTVEELEEEINKPWPLDD